MANYSYITQEGVIVPDTLTLLTQVQDEFKIAFGQDLITTLNTPQGVLIAVEVLARAALVANNAQLANQINPDLAGGVFLDALLQLMGAQRLAATHTIVQANLTGQPGTIIPVGSIAKNNANFENFETLVQVTLNGSGNASVAFQAINTGNITCAPNTLTIIVNGAVLGWETVNNPNAATSIGTATQSDVGARNLRKNVLASQSDALPAAIISAISSLDNVNSLTFRENISSSTLVIDGVTMKPHSIYVCVDGGDDEDIANSLVDKKSGGCGYNGDVLFPLTVPFSGQIMVIQFSHPAIIGILVRATVMASGSLQDPANIVKQAILAYAKGELPNEPGLVVGADVSCFELSGAVNRVSPSIFVTNMEISLISPVAFTNTTIPIEIFEKAEILEDNISVILL